MDHGDVSQVIQPHMPEKVAHVLRVGLECPDVPRVAYESRKGEGVEPGVRTNIEDVHTGRKEAPNRILGILLIVPEPASMGTGADYPLQSTINTASHAHNGIPGHEP